MSDALDNAKFKDFYYRQLDYIAKYDVDGLISNQYTEDAELIGFGLFVKGDPALRAHFRSYIAGLGYIKLLSTEKYAEGSDSMFFEATVETAGGIARVYDTFVLRDGKIWRHFTGLLGFTPKAQS